VGVRVTHWLNKNSLKFYEQGRVLHHKVATYEPKDLDFGVKENQHL
jgi:hypothetical protein